MLNSTQKAILRADIAALSQAGQPLETFIITEDWQSIAAYYNAKQVSFGWNTEASTLAISDSIDVTAFTQTDAPDSTAIFTNRALAIGIKQMNLQLILMGRSTIDASKAGIRKGLRDSVIALPSGAGGALVSAGGVSGVNVLTACTRQSTRLELMFANPAAQTGTVSAVIYTIQGNIDQQEVSDVWGGL